MSDSPTLTSKQRAKLRGEAHPLKPLVHVGKEGVTTAVIRSVEQALSGRELLKVRVLEAAPEQARDVAHAIAGRVDDCTVLQVLGRTATLYRPLPKT
jgi:RNA-binding protein